MGVEQKIPNDVKVTFFYGFYCLLTLSAWPGRLGAISKKATFMVAEQKFGRGAKMRRHETTRDDMTRDDTRRHETKEYTKPRLDEMTRARRDERDEREEMSETSDTRRATRGDTTRHQMTQDDTR